MSNEAVDKLSGYRWPGNVRELENVLERASAFCAGSAIMPEDLPPDLSRPVARPGASAPVGAGGVPRLDGMRLDELERLALEQTLEACNGNKAAAARRLGITEKTIYNMLARHRLGMAKV
jgi:DNA-binding NtrC family response regulator